MRRQSRPPICNVEVIRPTPKLFGPIEVIDGDTVRMNGTVYRLAGFDTPERGDLARCDDERRRAEAATARLRALIAEGVPTWFAWRVLADQGRKVRVTATMAACVDRCRSVDGTSAAY